MHVIAVCRRHSSARPVTDQHRTEEELNTEGMRASASKNRMGPASDQSRADTAANSRSLNTATQKRVGQAKNEIMRSCSR